MTDLLLELGTVAMKAQRARRLFHLD